MPEIIRLADDLVQLLWYGSRTLLLLESGEEVFFYR